MAGVLDSLMEQLGSLGTNDQVAAKLGIPPEQASSAVSAGVPAILAGLARNAQEPEGAAALATALDKDHDGSVLEDPSYFDSYQEKESAAILGHVFGGQTGAVQSRVSAVGGLNPAQGGQLLQMLAPLIMGYLGRQKSSGGILGGGGSGGLQLPGGLGDILGSLGGNSSASAPSSSSSSGLGGILGKLFRRKSLGRYRWIRARPDGGRSGHHGCECASCCAGGAPAADDPSRPSGARLKRSPISPRP